MDLIDYIGSLPPLKIARLYDSHFTCLAVLRSLSPIAKQYVYRFIFVDEFVPQAIIASWALSSASSKHKNTLETLLRLQILTAHSASSEPAYLLHSSFQSHIRSTLCSGIDTHLPEVPLHVINASPSRDQVDIFASQQWETFLLFTVGGGSPPSSPLHLPGTHPLDIGNILISSGIIASSPQDDISHLDEATQKHLVTQHGFQFLLADTYSQLWQVLRQYIAHAEEQTGNELSSALGFLMQLGFQGTKPMQFSELTPDHKNIAGHMCQLGILYPFSLGKKPQNDDNDMDLWLMPTRLAVLVASGSSSSSNLLGVDGGIPRSMKTPPMSISVITDGFIIVETNYRVYAYTSSAVRQSILRLFVRCDVLLPNLFVGTIDRNSIVASLENGVTAEQIIKFLRQHAHPRVATRVPVVPSVVSDQIRLWHRELHRLTAEAAVLYKNFEGGDLYRSIVKFAEKMGGLLLKDDAKREIVMVASDHEDVKAQIKLKKKEFGYT